MGTALGCNLPSLQTTLLAMSGESYGGVCSTLWRWTKAGRLGASGIDQSNSTLCDDKCVAVGQVVLEKGGVVLVDVLQLEF